MNIDRPVPKIANSTFKMMISKELIPETRGWATRRYIEIIIDVFLSEELKMEVGEEKFYRMSLGERIKGISEYTSKEVINILYRIKDFGDIASHYNPNIEITSEDAEKIANEALGIFEWILIDYFKKNRFDKTYNTAKIFSVLFPELRANVLEHFVDKKFKYNQYDKEIFHKYILALVKANRVNKAKRVLEEFKKKGYLGQLSYLDGKETIKNISNGVKNKNLPIPIDIFDCKRNFADVMKDIDPCEKIQNEGLIKIIDKLLENYEASEMGSFIPNKVYRSEVNLEYIYHNE